MSFKIEEVVESGVCIGCGSCRAATGGRAEMAMTKFGALVAQLDKLSAEELTIADSVCPFSDSAQDEDRLGLDLFGGVLDHFHSKTGYYRSIRVGRIASDDVVQSSSGGLTTYLLSQLFDAGEIDGVIHVGESKDEGRLFSYALSQTRDELLGRRKSQYYPTEFSEVMLSVRGNGKRYAIVGTPCFIKASQLLAERDPVLRNQLVWRIAICCGHLKSAAFAEALAWQLGISPPDLDRVDFRVKRDGAPAYAYSFGAVARSDERWRSKPSIELFGGDWGLALFQLKACEFCDDIFGETADICFGDAWLSPFDRDWRGTNIVLSRSPTLDALLEHGSQRNEIWLDDLPLKSLIASQAGAFRHRWYGIATRLADARRRGEEVPRKRKSCYSRRTPFLLNEIIRARQKISRKSHELFLKAKECDDFEILVKGLRGDIDALIRLQRFDKFLHPYSILRKGLRVFSRIGNWMSRQR